MENIDQSISNVSINDDNIQITYGNGAVEELKIGHELFHQFREKWLKPNPAFISDLYKTQMRDISFACINSDEKCCCRLKTFFSSSNVEEVKKFFEYMRSREETLKIKKAQWKVIS